MSKKIKKQTLKSETPAAIIENTEINSSEISNLKVGLMFAAAIFLSYIMIWKNGLIWDDDMYITLNEAVNAFDLRALLQDFHVGNYHPLTMLSLGLEQKLFGQKPWVFHLTNLLLHSANTYLLYLIFRKLKFNQHFGIILGLLFALHPLHVESVAWAAERKDVLYTFFLFLSFYKYLDFAGTNNLKYYLISLLFFLLACFSKGMAVVLPALLIITDWWMLDRKFSVKDLMNKIPYFAITLIFAYIATTAQKQAGADATSVIKAAYSGGERVQMVTYSYLFYWIKTLLPFNLFPFYPYPAKPNNEFPSYFMLYLLSMIAFIGTVYWLGRKNKKIWWGVAFFTIAISTVLQILPVGSAIVADRYYYLSSVGPLFLLCMVFHKFENIKWLSYAMVVVCAIMTFFQTQNWKNGLTLFGDSEKVYPNDAMILSNIGWHYLKFQDFPTAKAYLKKADDNGFKNGDVCRTLGSLNIDEGDYKTALKYLERAQGYLPKAVRTDYLTALAYQKSLDFNKASEFAKRAYDQDPEVVAHIETLANNYINIGKFTEARELYKKQLLKEPTNNDAALNISYSYKLQGDKETEIKLLADLIKKSPDYMMAYKNIGLSLAESGRNDETISYWKQAASYDKSGDYEYNIGINYATRGKISDAQQWYIKAAQKGKKEAIDLLNRNGVKF